LAELAGRFCFDRYHRTGQGELYWQEEACWMFSDAEIEGLILPAARTLHGLLMEYVEAVCADPGLLAWAGIPPSWSNAIRRDWRRSPATLLLRLDLAYDGQSSPKLLECEAEAVGSIFETGFFQLQWLDQLRQAGRMPAGVSQWNRLHEALVGRFAVVASGSGPLHVVAASQDREDWLQARYLAACAAQAQRQVHLLDIGELELDPHVGFMDPSGRPVQQLLMLYRWSRLLSEPFSGHLLESIDRGLHLLAPSWTQLLSSKVCLAGLWRLFPGHPLLLSTRLEAQGGHDFPAKHLSKPVHGHRGEGIILRLDDGSRLRTSGDEGPQGSARVIQEFAGQCLDGDLSGGHGAGCRILSTWLVGGRPVALGVREASEPLLTGSNCRYVPHAVIAASNRAETRSRNLDFVNPPAAFRRWMSSSERLGNGFGGGQPRSERDRGGFGGSGSRDRLVILEASQPRPRGPRSTVPA